MEFKIILVVMAALIASVLLVKNTSRWSRSLQRYYIDQSNRLYGNSAGWDRPSRLALFKTLVIFFGLMAVLAVYVAVFSQA
jgi:hypothetical protein